MRITATKLRNNIYRILDQVAEKGTPVEVLRKGTVVKLVADNFESKLARLKKHPDCYIGDPDEIAGMDWSKEWTELK